MPTTLPCIFDADANTYYHQFGNRIGVGSYDHKALLVDSESIALSSNTELSFCSNYFAGAKRNVEEIIPSIAPLSPARAFHGLMTFAPDGFPLIGPIPKREGLFVAIGVWVMHSVGLGHDLAHWIIHGSPPQGFATKQLAPDRDFSPFSPSRKDPKTREAIGKSYEGRCYIPKELLSNQLNISAKL